MIFQPSTQLSFVAAYREAKISDEGQRVLFPPSGKMVDLGPQQDYAERNIERGIAMWDISMMRRGLDDLAVIISDACPRCRAYRPVGVPCPECGEELRYSEEEQQWAMKRYRMLKEAYSAPLRTRKPSELFKKDITREYIHRHTLIRKLRQENKKLLSKGLSKNDTVKTLARKYKASPEVITDYLDPEKRPRDIAIEGLHNRTGLSVSTLGKYIRTSHLE